MAQVESILQKDKKQFILHSQCRALVSYRNSDEYRQTPSINGQ